MKGLKEYKEKKDLLELVLKKMEVLDPPRIGSKEIQGPIKPFLNSINLCSHRFALISPFQFVVATLL